LKVILRDGTLLFAIRSTVYRNKLAQAPAITGVIVAITQSLRISQVWNLQTATNKTCHALRYQRQLTRFQFHDPSRQFAAKPGSISG
jgi:hypothetical protein